MMGYRAGWDEADYVDWAEDQGYYADEDMDREYVEEQERLYLEWADAQIEQDWEEEYDRAAAADEYDRY